MAEMDRRPGDDRAAGANVPVAVVDAVVRSLGAEPTELRPTAGGHVASWYGIVDGTPFVLKVSPLAAFEAWALTQVRAHGVPAPEVLAVEPGGASPLGDPYLLTRRVSGRALSPDRTGQGVARRAGAALRAIHEVAGTGFGSPDSDALRDGRVQGVATTWAGAIVDWVELFLQRLDGRVDAATAGAVRRALDAHAELLARPVRSTLVHGDFTPRHIVVSRWGRIGGVVDFGGAQFGAPAYDLAVFSLAAPRLAALAEGYEEDVTARRSLLEEVPFYRMVRSLAEAAWADMAGVDPTRTTGLLKQHLSALGDDVSEPS